MIFIGADHRGFKTKTALLDFLTSSGHQVTDSGAHHYSETDDFNDPAIAVATAIQSNPSSKGILICGSAHGMVIQANRFKSIRAITATTPELVKLGRQHNDANILCLSADFLNLETIKQLVTTFLTTDFDREQRHQNRINRLDTERNTNVSH